MLSHALVSAEVPAADRELTSAAVERDFTRSKPYLAFQDAILFLAIVELALDDLLPRDELLDIVFRIIEEREQGRIDEVFKAARAEAAQIPDWKCTGCAEINPGTFDICWNCEELRPVNSARLSRKAEVVLAIESTVELRREPDSAPNGNVE